MNIRSLNSHCVGLLNSMNRRLDRPVVCDSLAAAVSVAEAWGAREGRDLAVVNVCGVVATWSPGAGISYVVARHLARDRNRLDPDVYEAPPGDY